MNQAEEVRQANKRFYEQIAPVYESVDPRRSESTSNEWIVKILDSLRTHGPTLLDAGCGSGFLTRLAVKKFEVVFASDLSQPMLDKIESERIKKICCSCEKISLPNEKVNVVTAFATLHHLYDPKDFFLEAFRILKPGGVLYTDHDIEKRFVKNFSLPLRIYRHFFDHGKEYLLSCPQASIHDYTLSEFHGQKGLDGEALKKDLLEAGFSKVKATYHWRGLLPITPFWNIRGASPIIRMIAYK